MSLIIACSHINNQLHIFSKLVKGINIMKRIYEKPIFTKTMYISIDNIAEDNSYIFTDVTSGIVINDVTSQCSCDVCYTEGICVTVCSTGCD